jgi:L-ascorbate metabolism protein UlaG (beta-lactamase superfamily)
MKIHRRRHSAFTRPWTDSERSTRHYTFRGDDRTLPFGRTWPPRKLSERYPIAPAPHIPDVGRWPDRGLFAAWLGHSSVLLKIDGVIILTDPILGRRAGVNLGVCTVGIRRDVAPALTVGELPRPDLVVLSHAHMDHFDTPTLGELANPATAVVTAKNTADLLRFRRFRSVHELAWNEQIRLGDVSCKAVEANHWGARYGSDTHRGYNAYVLECGRYKVLFAGDTALTDSFGTLKDQQGIDLAIMPVGAYNPRIDRHCSPEQAWQMANAAGAEHVMPVHHSTFRLSQEAVHEPLDRFVTHLTGGDHRIVASQIGQEFQLI